MIPGLGRTPRGGNGNPLHEQRSLEAYNPFGSEQSDVTEQRAHKFGKFSVSLVLSQILKRKPNI